MDDVGGGAPSNFKKYIFSHNKQTHQSFLVYEISLKTQAFNKVFLGDCQVPENVTGNWKKCQNLS